MKFSENLKICLFQLQNLLVLTTRALVINPNYCSISSMELSLILNNLKSYCRPIHRASCCMHPSTDATIDEKYCENAFKIQKFAV